VTWKRDAALVGLGALGGWLLRKSSSSPAPAVCNPAEVYDQKALEGARAFVDVLMAGDAPRENWMGFLHELAGTPPQDSTRLGWENSVNAVFATLGGYVFNPKGEPVLSCFMQRLPNGSGLIHFRRPRGWPKARGIWQDAKLRASGLEAIDKATATGAVVLEPLIDPMAASEAGVILAYPGEGAYVIRRKTTSPSAAVELARLASQFGVNVNVEEFIGLVWYGHHGCVSQRELQQLVSFAGLGLVDEILATQGES
jgi:hypothetical protein